MRRKSRKLVLWIGATILALLVIGTFAEPPEEAGEAPVAASDAPDAVEAAGEEPAAAKDDSPRTVEFGHEARVAANTLVVEGKTDLPDGALVAWGGTGGGMIPDSTDAGQVTVADGRFAIRRSVRGWGDAVEIWAAFQMGPGAGQPAHVAELYGPNGENLTGPNVITIGSFRRVERAAVVAVPRR